MKRFLIIFLFAIFIYTNTLLSNQFGGLYLTPKVNFRHEALDITNKVEVGKLPELDKNNYVGVGLALGYDFFRMSRLVPIRVDLEYLFDYNLSKANSWMNSFLVNVYYDINVFFLKNDELDSVTSKALYARNPNMSLYIGLSFGNRLYQSKSGNNIISKSSFVYGINAGLSYNINAWFALDLGYRYLLGFGIRNSHEVLFGTRFTLL